MKITLLTFGIAREITGNSRHEIDLPEGFTTKDLLRQLQEQYPALQGLASLVLAVNETYQPGEIALAANDEVALIPPVSGG